jgi:uncharacterized protein with FMN-binding domain
MRNALHTDPGRRSADSASRPVPLALPPRRAVVTLVATALGLVLLFSFKTPDETPAPGGPAAIAFGTPAPIAASPAAPKATPGPVGAATSAPPASSAPPATPEAQQVDGDVVGTQFGDIQVRLVLSGGKIVDVQALQLPNDRRRSTQISQFSEPILHSEALQAQSAKIDTVSGATYTSEAYRESLQSALDRVHS